ncbi:hypothetical protein [Spiroplasma alleghenense]|uniref:Uncharacterized protein n=1 Tax=Spiroplasma alleghenense TaxID=216931 RepID=A0A345Z574_9MOLU|nr:hypothetical protein [Spiroplasma alleghenense]AXK51753.1 hypothetical protein SALLE_v1c10830 [Spiroplasma alleghenense]
MMLEILNLYARNLFKAIHGDVGDEEALLKDIKGNDPKGFYCDIKGLYSEMKEEIKNGAQISQWLNQYALIENSKSTGFSKLLKNSKSKFILNKEKDANTLAVFGTKISGLKFQLKDSEFGLDDKYIFVRQEITRKNTLEYYNDFIEQAWEFHKIFLDPSIIENKKTLLNIQTPKTWKKEDFLGKTFNAKDFPTKDILYANSEANSLNSDFDFSLNTIWWFDTYSQKRDLYEIYINNEGYLYCYNTNKQKDNFIDINRVVLSVSLFGDMNRENLYQPSLDFYNYNTKTQEVLRSEKEEQFDKILPVFKLKFFN